MLFYFLFPIIYLLIFVFSEILYRKGVSGIITRKLDHILGGVASLFLPYFTTVSYVVYLGLATAIALIFLQRKKILKSLNNKRNIEFGAIVFPLSIVLSAVLWYNSIRNAFYLAVIVMTFADSFACLLGYFWGSRYKIEKFDKTMLGCLSFFAITFFVFVFFVPIVSPVVIFWIILIALVITIIELITPFGLDNLTVPIISGFMYLLLDYFY